MRGLVIGKDKGGEIGSTARPEWRQAACLVALTTPHDYGTGQQQEYLRRSIESGRPDKTSIGGEKNGSSGDLSD